MKKRGDFKIGIFGGLFDPSHIGHLIIAQWVMAEFDLAKVIFVPAANPPHKLNYSPYNLRYALTALAIKDNKRFSISDVEKEVFGKTYTVEIIKKLKKKIHGQLHLIIGSDQWQEIETWKDPTQLFKECKVIVVPRPNYEIKKSSRFYRKILISHSPLIDISSTMIREMIIQNIDIRYLVPQMVYDYIKTKKLYR